MALQDLTPQLRTRLRKVEWMVVLFLGGTTLLMLASLGWFIFRTGEARGWWVDEVPYYTFVGDATGIKVGTPVHMMGFKVGEVTKVDALPLDQLRSWDYYQTNQFRAFVGFKVRDKEPSRYPGYIGSDSRVKLGGFPVEIAGGVVLEISVGSMGGTLTTTNLEGGRIGVLSDKFAYDELSGKKDSPNRRYLPLSETEKGYYLPLDQSETLLAQVQQVLAKVRGIGTKVDAALPGLTEELYLTMPHVISKPQGPGVSMLELMQRYSKVELNVRVTTQSPFELPFIVPGTTLIATVPESVATRLAPLLPIRILTPPHEIPDSREILVWHKRNEADPGHDWLRSLFIECSRQT